LWTDFEDGVILADNDSLIKKEIINMKGLEKKERRLEYLKSNERYIIRNISS
jgi:hypothetical protein